jgi:hypothetical protein
MGIAGEGGGGVNVWVGRAQGTTKWIFQMKSELFAVLGCYATYMVLCYRRFGTTYRNHLQGSSGPLKKGPICCPQMSLTMNLECSTSQKSEDLQFKNENKLKCRFTCRSSIWLHWMRFIVKSQIQVPSKVTFYFDTIHSIISDYNQSKSHAKDVPASWYPMLYIIIFP